MVQELKLAIAENIMKIDFNATRLDETNDRFTQYVIEKEHIH